MPRTLRQVAALPDLSGVRLACCMHLDMKMIPLVQGILDKGAQVFLTTCNPTTVQDDVVAWLLAAELAMPLAKRPDLSGALAKTAAAELRRAQMLDRGTVAQDPSPLPHNLRARG